MADHSFNFDNTYINLPEIFYTELSPTPVRRPEMVIFNTPVAENMGLDFSGISTQEKATLFSGNNMPEGSQPFAQAYAGHQFGNFTMLGDG